MSPAQLLVEPFAHFAFMRRALAAILILSTAAGPVGTLLILRRMSLMGDALSHAVLPGAALGFFLGGLSLPAMSLGGALAGLLVALAAGAVSRATAEREDTAFAALYLVSLALGVAIVSLRGSGVDLLRILFGSILAIDAPSLLLIAGVASATLLLLAVIYRPIVLDTVDPGFLAGVGGRPGLWQGLFMAIVVANLVAGFQALGTLMAVGLIMLPAAAARMFGGSVPSLAARASLIAALSGVTGLLLSFHLDLPTGPAIILAAGAAYAVALAARRRR